MDQQAQNSLDSIGVFASPLRTLAGAILFVFVIFVISSELFVLEGWSVSDATYMVILTLFSVGYGEVHPINTVWLRTITIGTMVLGCTGMIFATGALVQLFASVQLRKVLGLNAMQNEIERLANHTVICGFGRIGVQLAMELNRAGTPFVILERDPVKVAAAEGLGYLCYRADATDETALQIAHIDRARVLATVLPDDAANVFITLSARNMNPDVQIIARGEVPTTESKLYHAGADRVVLPTHIGAERIAEMILYPATAAFVDKSDQMRDMKRGLHEFGLELETVTVIPESAMAGETVGEAERRSFGAFFIVEITRISGQSIAHPAEDVRIEAGDQIVLVVRGSRVAAGAVFSTPAARRRAGRGNY